MTTSDARAHPDQRRAVAEAFAHPAFDGAKRDNAPSFVLTADPFGVVWANPAAAALFDAPRAADLASVLSQPGNDMARWTADLLRRLPAGAPRLERRRVAHRLSSRMLTLLCGRVETGDGRPALGIAVMGVRGDPAHGTWQDGEVAPDDASLSGASVAAVPAAQRTQRLRFVWKTDVLGQILHVDTGPLESVGASVLPSLGHRLAETIRGFDPAAAERLAGLLGPALQPIEVEVAWPASGGGAVVPVSLKATACFDASRAFAGYRGFGLVDLTRLTPVAPASTAGSHPIEADAVPAEAAPAGVVADQEAHRPAADAEETQTRPAWLGTKPFPVLANVVQLRPTPAVRPPAEAGETAHQPTEAPSVDEAAAELAPAATGLTRASPDEALAPSSEAGHLSSSEQEAFQEIGRTLQTGSFVDVLDEDGHDVVGAPGLAGPDAEVQRNAAALVDATAAGLVVVRGPTLLFANQAVLDVLHYATLADAEIGIGAALASFASRIPEGADQTIDLPGQDGEMVRLGFSVGPVEWSGSAARLWTLRWADSSDSDQSRSMLEAAPAATPYDERELLNVAGEPITLLDASGHVVTLNVAAERLFGLRLSRIVGQDVSLLLTPESRPAASAALGTLAGGASEPLTVALHVAAGEPRELEMRSSRIGRDRVAASWRDQGLARRSVGVEQDSPDREQRAGRQPELLAKLSHQIRTPLNAIIGFTEVMMDERFGPLGNPRYKDYLKDVHASGAQVMSLVNDLLDLSRIESGRHDLDLGAVDINRIIAEGVAQVQAEAHRARVIVRTAFSPRQPMVMADDGAARQIVANLLSNAIKFNEPGGQVIVSTTTSDMGTVLVRIRDTGVGMSDRDIETALEPFRQMEPSRQAEGIGLGLPLTKALVGANGASLSIRSRPGEGTMVEVTFQPAATPTRVPA